MKRLLFSIALISSISANGFAQSSFEFHNLSNVDITGTVLTLTGVETDYELDTYIQVKNNSGSAKNIKIKRYEQSVVSGSTNYFCWTVCYPPMSAGAEPVFPTPSDLAYNDYVTANANAYAPYNLIAYHKPNTTVGTSIYRFVAFDGANPNDSAYVDVQVDISAANNVNEMEVVSHFSTWPNPASSTTHVKYQLNTVSSDQVLVITDLIGARKRSYSLTGKEGTINVDLNEFATGIYFFSIISNGLPVTTKKVVVSR